MIKYIFNVKQRQRSGGAALEQQLPGYPLPWWPSSGPCPQGECRRCLVTSLPGPLPREEFDSLQFGPAQCRNPPHAAALVIKLSLALLPSWWARWSQNLRGAPPTSPECCGICHPRALRLLSPARQANPCMCLAIRGVQGLLRLRGPWGHQRDPPGPFTCSPQKIWGPMGSPCLRGAHHQALGVHLQEARPAAHAGYPRNRPHLSGGNGGDSRVGKAHGLLGSVPVEAWAWEAPPRAGVTCTVCALQTPRARAQRKTAPAAGRGRGGAAAVLGAGPQAGGRTGDGPGAPASRGGQPAPEADPGPEGGGRGVGRAVPGHPAQRDRSRLSEHPSPHTPSP